MKRIYFVISVILLTELSCDKKGEIPFAGSAQVSVKLQYQDALTDSPKDLPVGAVVQIFFNGSVAPVFKGKTTSAGSFTYKAPAIGKYKLMITRVDTVLQFSSEIVTKADIDSTRKNEYQYIEYTDIKEIELTKDQVFSDPLTLKPKLTGLRFMIRDATGEMLPAAGLCVYKDRNIFVANFPNCGGSIRYVSSNSQGLCLIAGLKENTLYYINIRKELGKVKLSNQYDSKLQEFLTGAEGTITPVTIALK